jgi:hypothetical protein
MGTQATIAQHTRSSQILDSKKRSITYPSLAQPRFTIIVLVTVFTKQCLALPTLAFHNLV